MVFQEYWRRRSQRQGDDVLLFVDTSGVGTGWELVGTRLDRYWQLGDSEWFGPGARHVLILGSDAVPGETVNEQNADSVTVCSPAPCDPR